jgi:hypothetical protein
MTANNEVRHPEPVITIRFDIDTITCLNRGVPELLKIAQEENIKFTFFVNMGEAVGYSPVIKNFLSTRRKKTISHPRARQFSSLEKLGVIDWLRTVLLNPKVGLNGAKHLRRIISSGHDLGLHGGRNHGLWHHCSKNWSHSQLISELDWGIQAMRSCGLPQPKMFSSPGFNSPDMLSQALLQKNFELIADKHEFNSSIIMDNSHKTLGLIEASTGLLGEPGGVGFFENWIAEGKSHQDMYALLSRIYNSGQAIMCYDHPTFTSDQGEALFRSFIQNWKLMGGAFSKLSSVVNQTFHH